MASANPADYSNFLDLAQPLFNQIESGLRQLDARTADLTELVALIDPLDTLKEQAQAHDALRVFYFAQVISDLLSEILCDRFKEPTPVVLSIQSALPVFASCLQALPGPNSDEVRATLEVLYGYLGKTVPELPAEDVPAPENHSAAPSVPLSFSEFRALTDPLLDQIGADLMTLDEDNRDLPGLVALMERFESIQTAALQSREKAAFQITFALTELLSGVLCERYNDPAAIFKVIRDSISVLRCQIEQAHAAHQPALPQTQATIEKLFAILEVPVVEMPDENARAASVFVESPEVSAIETETSQTVPVEPESPSLLVAEEVPSAEPVVEPETEIFTGETLDETKASTGLPENLDDLDLYKEFAFECNEHLENIEENILTLERDPHDIDLINAIFRPIHSMKGGAGFLSLKGINVLAHDTETLLDKCRKEEIEPTSQVVEACLRSVDALKHMVNNLVQVCDAPDPTAVQVKPVVFAAIREELHRIIEGREASPSATRPTTSPASSPVPSAAPEPVEEAGDLSDENYASRGIPASLGDPDDIELLKRFVLQCNEHTETIEEQILSLEQNPNDAELINGIFRAIHSIKGDAGFLYLTGISGLAHDTETLLDRLRNKQIPVSNRPIELCLASVDALKQMIGNLNLVLETKAESRKQAAENLPLVIFGPIRRRIKSFLENPEQEDAQATPRRLGEILVKNGDITAEQLEAALELQGAPLGEVLSKTGAATPAAVDKALEQQRAATSGGGATAAAAGVAKAIKVDTEKIDHLVNLVGELVIIESQVVQMALRQSGNDQILERNLSQLSKITKELQDRSMALRMMPIRQTFQKMTRLVRDASTKMNKKVNLVMTGEDVELDKTVVEQIGDPLVHMLRNAVDHGISSPAERVAKGKPETGTINLDAFYQGDRIKIRVKDDGEGLNRKRILSKAIENGLLRPDATPSDQEIFQLIFAPGFSTAAVVTDISGRGVGMDVVRRNIEKLRGSIEVGSEEGQGTTITISLPLTLAIIDGMVVQVGEEQYIIPTISIQESFRPRPEDFSTVTEQGELVNVRGSLIPLLRLYQLWHIEPKTTDPTQALVVIVENAGRRACVMVDELVGQQQIVIKNLGDQFRDVRGITGATILGNGRVGLILDVDGVIKRALES
jgi:two-component system chemotaxis sensor kinase CheA